jgi:16S rRNA G966 N2-methylase RsmD
MLSRPLISKLREVDWDFAGTYSDSAFSAIHWHPGRLAAQLATTLIGVLTKPGDTVLDPFIGSGTVAVEAQRLCREAIAIDLNPIACKIVRAKTIPKNAVAVGRAIDRLIREATEGQLFAGRKQKVVAVPVSVQDKWYTPVVRRELASLWQVVNNARGMGRLLAEAAFSASLLPVCRETRHWGYVCDNSAPKGAHGGDPLREYVQTLRRFRDAYAERDSEMKARAGRMPRIRPVRVVCEDARRALLSVPARSVDLVLTSPPYFGVSDYAKSQRLSYEWFGADIEPVRLEEIGARSKRHRRTAVEEYIEQLGEVLALAGRCLRPSGTCVVIIGESATREPVLEQVISKGRSVGFDLRLDLNRTVSSQRRQAPSIRGEHLLFFSPS